MQMTASTIWRLHIVDRAFDAPLAEMNKWSLGLLALMATEQQQPTPAQDGSEKRGMLGPQSN